MPNYISKEGKWYAAKERVGLKNVSDKPFKYGGETIQPGEDFVYKGADREALKQLALSGEEYFGRDFRTEPEFLQATRNMGFNSVDEYLEHVGYNPEMTEKEFAKKAEIVNKHDLPKRVKEIKVMGGGVATGDPDLSHVGGFGDQRLRSVKEVK